MVYKSKKGHLATQKLAFFQTVFQNKYLEGPS